MDTFASEYGWSTHVVLSHTLFQLASLRKAGEFRSNLKFHKLAGVLCVAQSGDRSAFDRYMAAAFPLEGVEVRTDNAESQLVPAGMVYTSS